MKRSMHLLSDFHVRLAHISLVSPVEGSRGGYRFCVVLQGQHTHTFAFSSHDEAVAARAELLLALNDPT